MAATTPVQPLLLGFRKCEKYKGGISYTEDKANSCLTRNAAESSMDERGVEEAEGHSPNACLLSLQPAQSLLSSLRQGPSPRSLAMFWAQGTFLNRNRLLQSES